MSNPPIYVINLKRTPERKLHIQRQLDALNLRYQFVEAIDKYDLHSQAYREAIAHQLDIDKHQIDSLCKMRRGQAACALSHIKVYNLMIKNNIPQACILEDDCWLLPTFPKILVDSQVFLRDVIMFSHQSELVKRKELRKNFLIKLIMLCHKAVLVRARLVDFCHYSDKRRFFYRLLRLILYKRVLSGIQLIYCVCYVFVCYPICFFALLEIKTML